MSHDFIKLAPYLLNGRFVITHKTAEMYFFINDKFLCRSDGLMYTRDQIPEIYIITKVNYHMIAYGMNRWSREWCFRKENQVLVKDL